MRVIIIPVIGIIFFSYCIFQCLKFLGEGNKEMKSHVGEKIVIEKDTLIILDYSYYEESYNLSNGSKINKELLTRYPIIKK